VTLYTELTKLRCF